MGERSNRWNELRTEQPRDATTIHSDKPQPQADTKCLRRWYELKHMRHTGM